MVEILNDICNKGCLQKSIYMDGTNLVYKEIFTVY